LPKLEKKRTYLITVFASKKKEEAENTTPKEKRRFYGREKEFQHRKKVMSQQGEKGKNLVIL